MKRFIQTGLLIATLVLVAACTSVGTYKAAEIWISWKLNALVELDRDQKDFLSTSLNTHLTWHRTHELDRYVAWIEQVEARPIPASATTISELFGAGTQLYLDALEHILPDANQLLRSFNDDQAAEFVASLAEKQEKYIGKYADMGTEKLRKERVKRSRKSLKKYIGRLNEKQDQLIENWAADMPQDNRIRERNERWLAAFTENLNQRETAESFDKRNTELMTSPEVVWSDETRELLQNQSEKVMQLIADLDASLTDKQQARLAKELNKRKEKLQKLAE